VERAANEELRTKGRCDRRTSDVIRRDHKGVIRVNERDSPPTDSVDERQLATCIVTTTQANKHDKAPTHQPD
jgi:hypothetical protein